MTAAAATTPRLPSWAVRAYFIAELAGTVILEMARHLPVGFDTDSYRVLYCLALLPIRALACLIAWRQSKWMSTAAIPLGLGLLYCATHGIHPSVDQWISIIDGVVITSAGLGLAFSAAFSPNRNVYATLTVLWMMLGLFDFGYALQPFGQWSELNDSLLPVMVIGAFGWIVFSVTQDGRRTVSQRQVS